jgi:hypothetical protein
MIESKYLEERRNKMTNTITWQERIAIENARVAALTDEQKIANAKSHVIGIVDDCYRCINCEIGSWNAWKEMC